MSSRKQRDHLNTLHTIMKNGTATVAVAGINAVEAIRLQDAGLLKRAGFVRTGGRGRPAVSWRVTDKGRKRVKRAVANGTLVA